MGVLAGSLVLPGKVSADQWQIDVYSSSGIDGTIAKQGHVSGASEGTDAYDWTWVDYPPSMNSQQIIFYTHPGNDDLIEDYRPANSKTIFAGKIKIRDDNATGVTSTNYYIFTGLDIDTNRSYKINFNMNSNYTANGLPFSWSGALTNGLRINTPGIRNASNGVEVATLDNISTFSLNFKDIIAGINETNTMEYGTSTNKSLEEYFYPTNKPGTRYRTYSVESTGVNVTNKYQ